MMTDLHGKVAIVTGASRGIGAAIAAALADAGAAVLTVSRGALDPAAHDDLAVVGERHAHYSADLSRLESVPQVVQRCLHQFGQIDILVNNAGIVRRAPVLEHSHADWDAVLMTNLTVPFFLAQHCAREMVVRGSGKIINVCSLLSFQGGITVPGYAAAKHGLAGVTKAMANELAPLGVNVNGLAPGYIDTENTAALRADAARDAAILGRIPVGRWGTTSDMVGAALFLACPASDYMHGQILTVDGGWLAR